MQPKPQRLVQKNLLYSINTAVNSKLFRHCFIRGADGQEYDALDNGGLSCAAVVSGILVLNDMIDKIHATVQTTVQAMLEHGWVKTEAPVPGSVVHWPPGPNGHEHLGFYIAKDTAMSNSSEDGVPALQDINMSDGREPDAFYVHPKLLS